MDGESRVTIREADLGSDDAAAVGRLVEAYLRQTEAEKAQYLGGSGELPERYRAEVDDPRAAYAEASVMLAELEGAPVGVVVVQQQPEALEIKRVWVDPSARGKRVGSALLDAAMGGEAQELPIRLTVWDWRAGAIQLYRSRGFVPVASWDDRPRLLCFERRPTRAS